MTTSPIPSLHVADRVEGVQTDGSILLATTGGMVYIPQEILAVAAVRSMRETGSTSDLVKAARRWTERDAADMQAKMRADAEAAKAARLAHPSSAPKLTVVEGGAS